ncbi:MAG: phosphodiester glycosidase family protein [Proteobacteria bacterium]|nr:phosphodiester glycosidase family protein [Pseudomonadota bacterium]
MWSLIPSAAAVTLALQTTSTPYEGVTLESWRASSPSTDVTVARVDLCASGVRVDATLPPSSYASTGSFAEDVGAQLASNGDFYTSGPRVYGNAIGQGVPWPLDQTGDDPAVAWEWFVGKYGWIAFTHDGVHFTHTEWTKENTSASGGWAPDTVSPTPPAGTIALVSGLPELVVEGETYTCLSSTADDCFPDRTDMRSRHPRMAMGLTEDLETFLLVAVDGRTSSNTGMYGAELADVMGQLGAWEAFNIDGGGSTQMWSDGYVNDYSGNNSGGSARSVANHWAVFAPGSGRPGSCVSETPCELLGPTGGTLDDASSYFQLFGDAAYWRSEDVGHDGHLY